jgi:hypothetical protein
MKSRATATIIYFLIASSLLAGQSLRSDPPPLKERLFVAGNMGLQFGTYTNIQFAPAIGLWILPRMSVAAGPTYQFYKDPYGKTNMWGPRVYSEFLVIRDLNNIIPVGIGGSICTHIEYDGQSLRKDFWQNPYDTGRFYVNTFMAGFGFNQPVGPRSFMTLTILWEMTDSGYELYGNPEIRIGFMF